MTQHEIAHKATEALIQAGIVEAANRSIVEDHFKWAVVAGFEMANNRSGRKAVIQSTLSGKLLDIYPSLTEASEKTLISMTAIFNACNEIKPTAGGYRWQSL